MKAGVLYANDDIRYEEYPTPKVDTGEVLIKVAAAGICGSDISRVLKNGAYYYPIILGHEFSGIVEEIGKSVTSVKVGDRIAGVPLIPCMNCEDCKKGNYSQCKFYSFVGSRMQGSFAEYVKLPEQNVIKLSNTVTYEQGAFFEPATVALHGLMCTDYKGGEDVAILGGGTIGLFTMQWAKIYGAKRVVVFDIDNDRLTLAIKFGADEVVNTLKPGFIDEVGNFGFVYETAGVDVTMKLAFQLADNKANVCFIGTPSKDLVFKPSLFEYMNRKEFKLTGSWMSYTAPFPGKEWDLTAYFFGTGKLKFEDSLIFKKLPMSEIKQAFDMYKSPGTVKGKILLINEV